jgi:hypothetical protein
MSSPSPSPLLPVSAPPASPASAAPARPAPASLDRAFEVFRASWRRAAFAQLALALVTLASTALVTALLSVAAAACAIRFTRNDGFFTARMMRCVSATAWHTKGRVVATGALRSMRLLAGFTVVAILFDLTTSGACVGLGILYHVGQLSAGDSSFCESDYSSTSGCVVDAGYLGTLTYNSNNNYDEYKMTLNCGTSPSCILGQNLFALAFLGAMALPLLAAHAFISFASARAWLADAGEWLELLPRPKPLPTVEWELAPPRGAAGAPFAAGDGGPPAGAWAAEPLLASGD